MKKLEIEFKYSDRNKMETYLEGCGASSVLWLAPKRCFVVWIDNEGCLTLEKCLPTNRAMYNVEAVGCWGIW